jgi:hypothetical protein
MNSSTTNVSEIISLVLKAVALAMAVAVVVLGILDVVQAETSITLLGIGLFCLALDGLDKADKEEDGAE